MQVTMFFKTHDDDRHIVGFPMELEMLPRVGDQVTYWDRKSIYGGRWRVISCSHEIYPNENEQEAEKVKVHIGIYLER